jgi:hypothetical protein
VYFTLLIKGGISWHILVRVVVQWLKNPVIFVTLAGMLRSAVFAVRPR